MATTIRFNVNDRVRVVLTEASVAALDRFNASLNVPATTRFVLGDVWETEFWVLCQALGGRDGAFSGLGPTFDNNSVEITIEESP